MGGRDGMSEGGLSAVAWIIDEMTGRPIQLEGCILENSVQTTDTEETLTVASSHTQRVKHILHISAVLCDSVVRKQVDPHPWRFPRAAPTLAIAAGAESSVPPTDVLSRIQP